MDLRSCLLPDDLFVSYWLDDDLIVVSGDHTDVLSVERADATGLKKLVYQFEQCVTRPDHYTAFIAADRRPMPCPDPAASPTLLIDLSILLSSRLITPQVRTLVSSGLYRRLLLFPDGILHVLPLDRLICADQLNLATAKGVIYAPSASAYAYACGRKRKDPLRHALIVIGDRDDELLNREAQKVAECLPCQSNVVTTREELLRQTERADLLYIASHGTAPDSQDANRGWALLFDGATLSAEDFYRERVRLARSAVVVLSACSVGRLTPGPAHELDGLIHALFFGGAATIMAARWPVLYEAAEAVFLGAISQAFNGSCSLSMAFQSAVTDAALRENIQSYMASPESELFFSGPFALFGCGD